MSRKANFNRILTGVIGASSGLTTYCVTPESVERMDHLCISNLWTIDKKGMTVWDLDILTDIAIYIKSIVKNDDIVALAMPGADIVLLDAQGRVIEPIIHYKGLMGMGYMEQVLKHVTPNQCYKACFGANVAPYQPYVQLSFIQEQYPDNLKRSCEIVPLADFITLQLTGNDGHDQVMRQSQGLINRGWLREFSLYGKLFGDDLCDKIMPWSGYCGHALSESKGAYFMPTTHDSVWSRMVGFAVCNTVIWTGSWIGTAVRANRMGIKATDEMFQSGIAIEGIGESQAAITNIAMLGEVYAGLVRASRFGSYAYANEKAQRYFNDKVRGFDLSEMPQHELKAAAWVLKQYQSPAEAIAGLMLTAAIACKDNLDITERILGLAPYGNLAITGGWAENKVFIAALNLLGYDVKISQHSKNATHAGLAAEALARRLTIPFSEALEMIPQFPD